MAGCFKAYDVRGVVGEELDAERAYLIGRGLAARIFPAPGPVVVTRDIRLHSPELAGALIRGLCEGGCAVLELGLGSTPMNCWAIHHYRCAGGVSVTASHNAAEYNGFKVSGPGTSPVDYATGLNQVETFVISAERGEPLRPAATAELRTIESALPEYLDWMDGFVRRPQEGPDRKLRVGVDAANGMAGYFLPDFFARHPFLEAVPLYWELDGRFPNHDPDPLKFENLRPVQHLVREHACDFGIAFDGDADRCVVVDERGDVVTGDLLTGLLAGEVLRRRPGSRILHDVRTSRAVPEWIREHGGEPVRGKVGHTFMKRLLKESGAPFGGELSGHYYFEECFWTDSALMAQIQVINLLLSDQRPLSEQVAPLRRYHATGELDYRVADAPAVLSAVEAHFAVSAESLDHLDGLTVEYSDWWLNLRPSNTEPKLRLYLEAVTPELRQCRLEEVSTLLHHVGI